MHDAVFDRKHALCEWVDVGSSSSHKHCHLSVTHLQSLTCKAQSTLMHPTQDCGVGVMTRDHDVGALTHVCDVGISAGAMEEGVGAMTGGTGAGTGATTTGEATARVSSLSTFNPLPSPLSALVGDPLFAENSDLDASTVWLFKLSHLSH